MARSNASTAPGRGRAENPSNRHMPAHAWKWVPSRACVDWKDFGGGTFPQGWTARACSLEGDLANAVVKSVDGGRAGQNHGPFQWPHARACMEVGALARMGRLKGFRR